MALVDQHGAAGIQAAPAQREIIYRHTLVVRVTHWLNVVFLTLRFGRERLPQFWIGLGECEGALEHE